jgi:hypothetical protein
MKLDGVLRHIVGTSLRMLLRPHTFFLGPQLSEQRSRQPSDGIAFLQVLDFDTNENVQVQIIGDIRKLLNEANEGPNLSKRITDLTNHLPNQAQCVVRLYIEQDCDKNYTYLTHLHSALKDFPLTGYCSDASRGFEAAAAQWSGTAHSSWCRAWSFGFSSFANIQKLQEEKGLNFRRLLGIGDTFTDGTMSMARASARALSTNLTRKVRQMCVLENHQEELVSKSLIPAPSPTPMQLRLCVCRDRLHTTMSRLQALSNQKS